MRQLSTALVLASLLVGCSVPSLTAPGTGAKPAAKLDEALNGVEFKPITAQNSKFLGNAAAGNAAAATTGAAPNNAASVAAPAPATAGTNAADLAGKAVALPTSASKGGYVSGNVYSSYGYDGYFGGPTVPMGLVSVTAAEAPGATGDFSEIVKAAVAPIIKAWSADARLLSSSAELTNDGALAKAPVMPEGYVPGPLEQAGWRLTYVSVARNEVLNFVVSGEKTVIVRMRYAPADLAPEQVQVGSTAAIAALIKAIKDKGFKAEEEKNGTDYFFGFPYAVDQGMAYGPGRMEPIYEVPADARWSVNLMSVMGKPVWQLNFYTASEGGYGGPIAMPAPGLISDNAGGLIANTPDDLVDPAPDEPEASVSPELTPPPPKPTIAPMPMPSAPPSSWVNNAGSGMVDARTGAVIRFMRPYRQYYDWGGEAKPYPVPMVAPSFRPTPL